MQINRWVKGGAVTGSLLGLACGLVTVVNGWDNYGYISIIPGLFASLLVVLTVIWDLSGYFIANSLILIPLTYALTGALSWALLGYLLSRKGIKYRIATLLYVGIWLLIGSYATLIVAVVHA